MCQEELEMADFNATDVARLEAVATDYERRRQSATARLIRRVIRRVQPSNDPQREDETLTTTEAAQLLGVSDQTVRIATSEHGEEAEFVMEHMSRDGHGRKPERARPLSKRPGETGPTSSGFRLTARTH